MFRTVGLIAVLLSTGFFARADQPRHRGSFISANGKFEATLQELKGSWRLIEKSTEKELYRFDNYYRDGIWFSSMTLVISDDGRSIVAVNDYAEDVGYQEYRKNPEVLFFFRDGKQFKSYRLHEMANPRFMEFSVSHFQWLYSGDKLAINDSKIELTTFDMNHFIFSTESGVLIKKSIDEVFAKGAIFVYGAVRSLSQNRFEIDIECSIRGDAKKGSRVVFQSDKIRWEGGGFNESLVLQDGQLIDRKGVLFNNCN